MAAGLAAPYPSDEVSHCATDGIRAVFLDEMGAARLR